jgi:hypothetical protein
LTIFSRSDKLINLALGKVCEQAIFLDETNHNALMEKLPSDLRPFTGI